MEKNQQTTRDSLIDLTDFMKIAEAADQYARQQNGGGAGSGIIQESFIQGCKHMASQFKSSEREQQAINLIERCEKTFGKINDIFTLLKENSDSKSLVELVEAIDVDIPQIQAIIKDELTTLKK